MKTIKILHLYYDLLNMYGESGNVLALVKSIEKHDIRAIVTFKSLDDNVVLNDFDLIYIGSGTDEAYELALNDIKKYTNELKEFINNNKFLIVTGNSLDLFSELQILDFKSKKIDFRIIGEQLFYSQEIQKQIIGFQNRDTVIYKTNERNLYEVTKGTGFEPNINIEGIHKKNFFGTYLLGPLLIRNPYYLEYIVKTLLEDNGLEYKIIKQDIPYKAYDEFISNFVNKNE